MALSESPRKQISAFLASNRVVLFMKSIRRMPQCGSSAQDLADPRRAAAELRNNRRASFTRAPGWDQGVLPVADDSPALSLLDRVRTAS